LATPARRGKRDIKYIGKWERVLLIKVIIPPLDNLDKYIIFQPAKQRSIFSIKPSQIDLALKGAPNDRPRYLKGKEDTLQPKILANPTTLLTLPTRTKFDLAKLTFKLDTASKHKNNTRK